jgi:hypothetical protein
MRGANDSGERYGGLPLNAVACLAHDMNRLDAGSREHYEPFFSEAAKIQGIIRALIDACLGNEELRRAGAPLFAYPLIPEGEEQEGRPDREALPLSPAQNIINITLSSLQAGSLAGALGEAFGGFASQTAALADIYSPVAPPGGTTGTDLPWGNVSQPPSSVTAGAGPGTIRSRTDTATVLESLSRSASVLHTLESVRTDLARTLFSKRSTVDVLPVAESRTQPGPLLPYSRGGELPQVPAQPGTSGGVTARAEHYPEPLGTMFTTLQGMLQKSERIADIPFPAKVPIGHPPLPQVPGPGIEIFGADFPVTAHRVPVAPEYPDRQRKPSRRTAKSPRPAPAAGIIEIPALVPGGVKDLRPEMATMNAARLSEGIARLSEGGGRTARPLSPEGIPQAAIRLSRGQEPSSPAVSVPDAFEKIAQYLTYSTAVHQELMAPLSGGITGSGPGIFSFPLPFLIREGGGGSIPGLILPGKDSGSLQDIPVMNLAVSMVSGDVMRKGSLFPLSAAGISPLPGMLSGSALPGTAPVSSLFSLEHALPLYAGPRSETAPPAAGGDTTTHFQNTFNITVTTSARGDEAELRELGRKIGFILSDEMKRYGGVR